MPTISNVRILLLSSDLSHQAELISAWSASHLQRGPTNELELEDHSFVSKNDILDLLDRVWARFLDGSVSYAASRDMVKSTPFLAKGQLHLRSRSEPLGIALAQHKTAGRTDIPKWYYSIVCAPSVVM